MCSSISIVFINVCLDIVLNASEGILDQSFMNEDNQGILRRAKGFGLDDLDVNISVIPRRACKFDNQAMN